MSQLGDREADEKEHQLVMQNLGQTPMVNIPQQHQTDPDAEPPTGELLRNPPPLLLRVHADDQSPSMAACSCLIIMIIFVIVMAVGTYGIPALYIQLNMLNELKDTNLAGCQNPFGFNRNGEVMCLDNNEHMLGQVMLKPQQLNQFGLLYLTMLNNTPSTSLSFNQNVQLGLSTLKIDNATSPPRLIEAVKYTQITTVLSFRKSNTDPVKAEDGTQLGYTKLIAFMSPLQLQPFIISLSLSNRNDLSAYKVSLNFYVINPQFTIFTIVIRFVFFAISIVAAILYSIRYLALTDETRTVEQKLIFIASILVISFNDPFYPITVLMPNPVSSFFSVFFICNLLAYIIFIWVTFSFRIYYEDGKRTTQLTWKFKIALAVVFWGLLIALYLCYILNQLGNPVMYLSNGYQKFWYLKMAVYIVFFLAVGVSVGNYIRVCINNKPILWRSFYFILITSVIMVAFLFFIGANAFEVYNYEGKFVLAVYVFFNTYIFYLMYFFTITKEQYLKITNHDINLDQRLTVSTIGIDEIDLDVPTLHHQRLNRNDEELKTFGGQGNHQRLASDFGDGFDDEEDRQRNQSQQVLNRDKK